MPAPHFPEAAGSVAWLVRRGCDLLPQAHGLSRREIRAFSGRLAEISLALAAGKPGAPQATRMVLAAVLGAMAVRADAWRDRPNPLALPALVVTGAGAIGLVVAFSPEGHPIVETAEERAEVADIPADWEFAALTCSETDDPRSVSLRDLLSRELKLAKPHFFYAGGATLVASVLAFASSLYSMQVYDRVIPTQGLSTLVVLTLGSAIAIIIECLLKLSRSALLDRAIREVDASLAHEIFRRLLSIRLDQLPPNVGTLAAQVRGYETLRAFAFAAILYVIDLPFAIMALLLVVTISGGAMASVILGFLAISAGLGLVSRKRIQQHAAQGTVSGNQRVGLLVETVEGFETLKSAGAEWLSQLRWSRLSATALDEELKAKHLSESASYLSGMVQQLAYIAMIAMGAYLATSDASVTQGSLVACSILSGRILGPVAAIPGLVVQFSQARIAYDNIKRLFQLRFDNDLVRRPLNPSRLPGAYRLEGVRFAYPGQHQGLRIERLSIERGEKVGIIGPIGSGKTTLLKLMSGLYAPTDGKVFLDGLDLQHIGRNALSDQCAYVPQDVRLFAGTVRDNILLGLPSVTDEELSSALRATGLDAFVAAHPKGLDCPVSEGGAGVSRGQRQLVGLTRALLAKPSIWLLDEPTAALDDGTETRMISVISALVDADATMVVVTHRANILRLVDRLIVLTDQGIVMDGPRDAVLARLNAPAASSADPEFVA